MKRFGDVVVVISAVLLIWFILSWADVVMNNDAIGGGVSNWNFFQVMI